MFKNSIIGTAAIATTLAASPVIADNPEITQNPALQRLVSQYEQCLRQNTGRGNSFDAAIAACGEARRQLKDALPITLNGRFIPKVHGLMRADYARLERERKRQ